MPRIAAPKAEPTRPTERGDTDKERSATDWSNLPFKVLRWQWARLTADAMPGVFPAGTIVCLVDAQQGNTTPTQRSGQRNDWQKSDVDTVYRIAKLVEEVEVKLFPSEDAQAAIMHKHLSRTRGGSTPSPESFGENEIVYLLPTAVTGREFFVKYPATNTGKPHRIPDGACGQIAGLTTLSAGRGGVRVAADGSSRNKGVPITGPSVQRQAYLVYFPLEIRTVRWVECNSAVNRAYLEPLSERESKVHEQKSQATRSGPQTRILGKMTPEEVSRTPIGAQISAPGRRL
ncbi:hypothetical protein BV20DRAFT_967733 [Pilatotrama ljubarskyi]|nr:hypothetical protein BV20DRAFT_967733 [Pilatotrama ljubarskyi]